MNKANLDWKCCKCGKPADYTFAKDKFCIEHWWEKLKSPPEISEEEVIKRNEAWRASRNNSK